MIGTFPVNEEGYGPSVGVRECVPGTINKLRDPYPLHSVTSLERREKWVRSSTSGPQKDSSPRKVVGRGRARKDFECMLKNPFVEGTQTPLDTDKDGSHPRFL